MNIFHHGNLELHSILLVKGIYEPNIDNPCDEIRWPQRNPTTAAATVAQWARPQATNNLYKGSHVDNSIISLTRPDSHSRD